MNKDNFDTVFVIRTKTGTLVKFQGHRVLFACWSESLKQLLFCKRFNTIVQDTHGKAPWIWLPNVTVNVFDWFCNLVYGKFPVLNEHNIMPIIKFAYQYQVKMLADWLFKFLCHQLNHLQFRLNVILGEMKQCLLIVFLYNAFCGDKLHHEYSIKIYMQAR